MSIRNSGMTFNGIMTFIKIKLGNVFNRHTLFLILIGQIISLCFCGTAVTSALLQRQDVNIPLFQNFCFYFSLSLTFTVALAFRNTDRSLVFHMKTSGWKFFLFAVADVEATFFAVSAYKYTTITSQQIINSFTMPAVMILSFVFLRTRYNLYNYVGASLSLVGLICIILSDTVIGGRTDAYAVNETLGDIFAVASMICYAIQNVLIEYFMIDCDIVEYLGTFSIFAVFINSIQMFILEREQISQVKFSSSSLLVWLIVFALCLYVGYILVPILIKRTSATWFGLNNLTVNFYVTIVGIFVLKYQLNYLYFVSFFCVIGGVLIYSLKSPTSKHVTSDNCTTSEIASLRDNGTANENSPLSDSPELLS